MYVKKQLTFLNIICPQQKKKLQINCFPSFKCAKKNKIKEKYRLKHIKDDIANFPLYLFLLTLNTLHLPLVKYKKIIFLCFISWRKANQYKHNHYILSTLLIYVEYTSYKSFKVYFIDSQNSNILFFPLTNTWSFVLK